MYLRTYSSDYNSQRVINLPNRTPNGLILPKRQNLLAYNYLHGVIVDLIEYIGLHKHIDKIHNPINIRYVESKPNEVVDSRPFSSTKWHTDCWNGEPANTVMVFVPVCGDLIKNGISFCEPNPNEFMEIAKVLKDYFEGSHLLEQSKHYDIFLDNEFLYLTDPYLLHKTVKKGGSGRLSIDFRFTTSYQCFTDVEVSSKRYENYIPYSEWAKIGKSKLLCSNLNIDEFNEGEINSYAGKYTTIDI